MTNIGIVASIIFWHCQNVCTIRDKHTKFTSGFLLKYHLIHHEIHKDPSIGLRLRAAYDTVMVARVVAGIVS